MAKSFVFTRTISARARTFYLPQVKNQDVTVRTEILSSLLTMSVQDYMVWRLLGPLANDFSKGKNV